VASLSPLIMLSAAAEVFAGRRRLWPFNLYKSYSRLITARSGAAPPLRLPDRARAEQVIYVVEAHDGRVVPLTRGPGAGVSPVRIRVS
jgi:hypothetical protein